MLLTKCARRAHGSALVSAAQCVAEATRAMGPYALGLTHRYACLQHYVQHASANIILHPTFTTSLHGNPPVVLPWHAGTDHSFRDLSWDGVQYRIHAFAYQGYNVWGLTATILIGAAKAAYGCNPTYEENCQGGRFGSCFAGVDFVWLRMLGTCVYVTWACKEACGSAMTVSQVDYEQGSSWSAWVLMQCCSLHPYACML